MYYQCYAIAYHFSEVLLTKTPSLMVTWSAKFCLAYELSEKGENAVGYISILDSSYLQL